MIILNNSKDNLIAWRKQIVAARAQWLDNIKLARKTDFIWLRRRAFIKFCKSEAADCLKLERACTQLIETIDGKRAAPGELKGNKEGQLSYRIPEELEAAFCLCRGIAEYGMSCDPTTNNDARM